MSKLSVSEVREALVEAQKSAFHWEAEAKRYAKNAEHWEAQFSTVNAQVASLDDDIFALQAQVDDLKKQKGRWIGDHQRQVDDLLKANNRYQEDCRQARRELAAFRLTLRAVEKQRDDTIADVKRFSKMAATFAKTFVEKRLEVEVGDGESL